MSSTAALISKMTALCRYIEAHSDQALTLAALSRYAHMSRFHLQRNFKSIVGVTPRQYLEACRLRSLKDGLRRGDAVSDISFRSGFGSSSRVYERVNSRLGMTPAQYRRGATGIAISYAAIDTAFGKLMMAATDRGICFVQFGASAAALLRCLRQEFPHAAVAPMSAKPNRHFTGWMRALAHHLADAPGKLALPLDVRGTAFQMRVWRYLQRIPSGEVRTYADVARGIGRPTAIRAVANACAANRVALVIPCHRVIRGDGSLGGYRWGTPRKRALLERERAGD